MRTNQTKQYLPVHAFLTGTEMDIVKLQVLVICPMCCVRQPNGTVGTNLIFFVSPLWMVSCGVST